MQFSRTLLLALDSLGCIGRKSTDAPIPLRDIASVVKSSPTYLSKVLQQMTRAGILSTVMGPHGGYHLARNPQEIRILDVVELFDGPAGADALRLPCQSPHKVLAMLHWCTEPSRERLANLTVADLIKAVGQD